MPHSARIVNQLVTTLLRELYIKNPTPEQSKSAERFVGMVILPVEENGISQKELTPRE